MALTAAALEVRVGADVGEAERGLDGISGKVEGAGEKISGFGRSMEQTGRTMTRNITAPIVGLGTAIVMTGSRFDAELSKIVGLVGWTTDEVDDMRASVLALSGETARAPQELAEALYFVASAGFEGQDALDVLTVSAKAAAGGLGETKDIADLLTSAVRAYGEENITAAEAGDILVAAVREGKLEASALAPVMGRLLPIASELGIQFDEVAGFLAAMSRTGLGAAEASTALRSTMTTLLDPSKEARDTLEEFGLSAADVRRQIREEGLLATLFTLQESFEGNDEALANVFGNVRGLTGVLNILGQDAETITGIFEGTANATGALDHAFDAASNTAQFQMNQAINDLKILLIDLSADVLPGVVEAFGHLSDMLRTASNWWNGLEDDTRKWIVQATAVTAVVGPLIIILSKLVQAIGFVVTAGGKLIGGLKAIGVAFGGLGFVVAGFAVALFGWFKDLERRFNALRDVWNRDSALIRQAWQTTVQAIGTGVQAVGRFIQQVVQWFQRLPGQIRSAMSGAGTWLVQAGRDVVSGLIRGITSRLGDALNTVRNMGRRIADAAKSALRIGSPSRVFMDIGHDVGEGFIEGLARQERDAARAMLRMIDPPKVTIPRGTSTTQGAGHPLTVNLPDGRQVRGTLFGEDVVKALGDYERRNGPVPIRTR